MTTYWVEDMEHNAYIVDAESPEEAALNSVRHGCYVQHDHDTHNDDGSIKTVWFAEHDHEGDLVDHLMVQVANDNNEGNGR